MEDFILLFLVMSLTNILYIKINSKKKIQKSLKSVFSIEIHFLSKVRLNSLHPIHYLNILKHEKVF